MNTLSRVLHGPGAAHLRTHNRRNATRACFQHAARSITGSHCTQISKGVRSKHAAPQNFWPATNLSSIKIHHIERHTGREWRIHPHMHKNTPHAYFGPAQTPPWTPLHSKRAHNIRHLRERAHLLPIKMHHIERCTGPEWRAHAHTRRDAPQACFGHAKSVPRALCSHMVLAMAPLMPSCFMRATASAGS